MTETEHDLVALEPQISQCYSHKVLISVRPYHTIWPILNTFPFYSHAFRSFHRHLFLFVLCWVFLRKRSSWLGFRLYDLSLIPRYETKRVVKMKAIREALVNQPVALCFEIRVMSIPLISWKLGFITSHPVRTVFFPLVLASTIWYYI